MTKTDEALAHLREHGPATAAQIASAVGLPNSGRVSALLKARIESGQVEYEAGKWQLNPDWDDMAASDLRDAVIILERAGYTVLPPSSRPGSGRRRGAPA